MESIFEIAANIKTPLALGGLIAVILFFLFKQILSAKGDQLKGRTRIVESIINKVFILALLALCLGVLAFFADKLHTVPVKNISATVLVDKKAKSGVAVIVLEIEKEDLTNSFGRVAFPYEFNKEFLTFKFAGFDTTLVLLNDSLRKDLHIYLSSKQSLTAEIGNAQLAALPSPVATTPIAEGKPAVRLLMPNDKQRFSSPKYPFKVNMAWKKVDWADYYNLEIYVSSDNRPDKWSNDRNERVRDTYFSYDCFWKNVRWRVTAINKKQRVVSGWRTFSVKKPD